MIDKVQKRYIDCFIASAEEVLFEGEIYSIKTKTTQGGIEILPSHEPIMAQLPAGSIKIIKLDDQSPHQYFYISGGTLEVQQHQTTVLVNVGKPLADIDQTSITEAELWAEEKLKTNSIDYQYVLSELAQLSHQQKMLHKAKL